MTNRECDLLVESKVMGKAKDPRYLIGTDSVPHYSTDMNASLPIIDSVLRKKLMSFDASKFIGRSWTARFTPNDPTRRNEVIWANAKSLELAICLAALKAVGYEVQE